MGILVPLRRSQRVSILHNTHRAHAYQSNHMRSTHHGLVKAYRAASTCRRHPWVRYPGMCHHNQVRTPRVGMCCYPGFEKNESMRTVASHLEIKASRRFIPQEGSSVKKEVAGIAGRNLLLQCHHTAGRPPSSSHRRHLSSWPSGSGKRCSGAEVP